MPPRLAAVLVALLTPAAAPAGPPGVRFEVRLAPGQVADPPQSGRVLVAVGPAGGRPTFTRVDPPALPVLGADADRFAADTVVPLDRAAVTFPAGALDRLPAGEYTVQAVFAANPDLNLPTAPGNRYCDPVKVRLDPAAGAAVRLTLDKAFDERRPADTPTHKYLGIPSKLLSDFWGRPMSYRVGVVLPPGFGTEPDKRYALLVRVGGFGQRYTSARRIRPDPRFVQLLLDGAGPLGDPYQVNSANHGPYGDALTTEVIPHVEGAYRCGGPKARFTAGGSTGGWVSLALQVFYPDVFNGCWSQCPDPVDFRAVQLADVYADPNMYVNRWGWDRPARRTVGGETVYTVRHECQLERVLGRGGRWELGGQQWASWNATFGPKGPDGRPVPLWDGETGAISVAAAKGWEKYDLQLVLKRDWRKVGPKLSGGKVNVWVGDADDYFLNNAVRLLKASLARPADPGFDGVVLIEPGKGHTSGGWTDAEMLDAMAARAGVR